MAKPIGQTIRILRQARQMKLSELAQKSRVSSPFLSLVEGGERQPSIVVLQQIAAALGVPENMLVMLATGMDKSLSGDKASKSIAESIDRLIEVEGKLKEALKSRDSANATKRRSAK